MQDFLAAAAGEMIFQVFPYRWQQSLNVRSVLYKLFFFCFCRDLQPLPLMLTVYQTTATGTSLMGAQCHLVEARGTEARVHCGCSH